MDFPEAMSSNQSSGGAGSPETIIENLKNLIQEMASVFGDVVQNVTQLVHSQSTDSTDLVPQLFDLFQNGRLQMDNLIQQTPELYQPTGLIQKIQELEQQKVAGFAKLRELQTQYSQLQNQYEKEKSSWEIREAKGKQMLSELQQQLQIAQNGGNNTNAITVTMDVSNDFANPDEKESDETKSKDMKALVLENKTLKQNLTALSEVQSHEVANKMSKMIRQNTKTEWSEEDLQSIKDAMAEEMKSITKANLLKLAEKSSRFYEEKEEDLKQRAEFITNVVEVVGPKDSSKEEIERHRSKMVRLTTKTEWNAEEMAELERVMNEQLKEMNRAQQKAKLRGMFDRADDIQSAELQGIERAAEERKAMAVLREDREDQEGERKKKEEQEEEEMKDEFQKMAKKNLASLVKKQALFEDGDDEAKVEVSESEISEMKKMLEAHERKSRQSRIMALTDPNRSGWEPTFNGACKKMFNETLVHIGIVNPTVCDALWKQMKESIQTIETNPNTKEETRKAAHTRFPSMNLKVIDDAEEEEEEDKMRERKEEKEERRMEVRVEEVKEKKKEFVLEENEEFQRWRKEMGDALQQRTKEMETWKKACRGKEKETKDLLMEREKYQMEKELLDERRVVLESEMLTWKTKFDEAGEEYKEQIQYVVDSKVKLIEESSKQMNELRKIIKKYNRLVNAKKKKNDEK